MSAYHLSLDARMEQNLEGFRLDSKWASKSEFVTGYGFLP